MTDYATRLSALSPEKRELFELLMRESDGRGRDADRPPTAVEAALATIWAEVLGVESVGLDDDFFELGGDSIQCIQIVAKARRQGVRITTSALFEHPTVAAVAAVATRAESPVEDTAPVDGLVPLTPIQRWFFELDLPNPHHWNQSVLLELRTVPDPARLREALQTLARHHDALRLRFEPVGDARSAPGGGGGWRQRLAPDAVEVPLTEVDLSHVSRAALEAALDREATRIQASLDVTHGPVLAAALFAMAGGETPRLLLVVHHLVVDAVSFRILLEDLGAAYVALRGGGMPALPAKTTSFATWARRIEAHAASHALRAEAPIWLRDDDASAGLPVDTPGGRNDEASAREVSVALTAEETQVLLQQVPTALRARIGELLLAAVVRAIALWTGNPRTRLEVEGHGREELFSGVDVSRTVGWFTSLYPVDVDLIEPAPTPLDALDATQQALRRLPQGGVGYGMLRFLARDPALAARARGERRAEVSFNYLGQLDGAVAATTPFAAARERGGSSYDPRNMRPHLLHGVASTLGGCFRTTWIYSNALHRRETVERVAAGYLDTLRQLLAAGAAPESTSPGPADFPEAELTRDELDRLLARMLDGEEA